MAEVTLLDDTHYADYLEFSYNHYGFRHNFEATFFQRVAMEVNATINSYVYSWHAYALHPCTCIAVCFSSTPQRPNTCLVGRRKQ